jgi:hypothetical protein
MILNKEQKMSKYAELKTKLTRLEVATENYWTQLFDIYQHFPSAMLDFLGIENNRVIDLNLNEVPVLSIGKKEGDKVVNTPAQMLDKEGKSLAFAIRLALCDESDYARTFLFFDVKMYRELSNVVFNIDGFAHPVICIRNDETHEVDFTPLCTAIYEFLQEKLSPKRFL